MMTGDKMSATAGGSSAATALAQSEAPASAARSLSSRDESPSRVAFQLSGTLLGPAQTFAWLLALLGVAACVAPWFVRGWRWLELTSVTVALLLCYDAFALWLARKEFAPVLLMPEKGLRGGEGQTIQLPLALAGSASRRLRSEVRVALMPATPEGETAARVSSETQRLTLERRNVSEESAQARHASTLLWSWTPEVTLLRRGLWPGPRVGIERSSPLGVWRLRQWFDFPERLRIDADLRSGRREILKSSVYRALVASRQTPWTGHGRDFERLREYQPGDTYSEIAWKSTARRSVPVTRLFQWEQTQEIYFVVDQSRASAPALDPATRPESNVPASRATRRLLDLAVETALVGATVALELGDEFGLVTYADEPKSWLRAGSGQAQFHRFRDRLLCLEPLPTTADYELLFGEIRLRLRRRAYLVLLADLTERSISESLCRGLGLVRSSHAVLMTSILPAYARPAFSPGEEPATDEDVYRALAGEKENQRLGALARHLRRLDVQLRFVPAEMFLRTAVEGYLQSRREQRL
ncbi:MAG: DUF58 domain-containing protein [Candidatus Acidiferrum sp.]